MLSLLVSSVTTPLNVPRGAGVGERVGEAVGDLVGEAVGLAVGDFVGDLVGEAVGELLGDPLGAELPTSSTKTRPGASPPLTSTKISLKEVPPVVPSVSSTSRKPGRFVWTTLYPESGTTPLKVKVPSGALVVVCETVPSGAIKATVDPSMGSSPVPSLSVSSKTVPEMVLSSSSTKSKAVTSAPGVKVTPKILLSVSELGPLERGPSASVTSTKPGSFVCMIVYSPAGTSVKV
mmetsp:Transcript_3679/g.5006  ORF Transcript_3679/g.5006 Transcript_3679/m.5006 type:complete len:234 (-) Transcript_3679:182-883(-)